MANEPTGSPPLPDDQQKELSRKIENVLGEPPQDSGKPEPAERFKVNAAEKTKVSLLTPNSQLADEPGDGESVHISEEPASMAADKSPDAGKDDRETDKAVDDIVARESDELIAAEDEKLAAAFTVGKTGFKDKIKRFFKSWWHNKIARYVTIVAAVVMVAVTSAMPTTRYFMLNTVGIRGSASLNILDNSTQQPLKNVQVILGGQTAVSDQDGNVTLRHVKLGKTRLEINKRAFAAVARDVVVGWGSNPIGTITLTPVGTQYAFNVSDFLSGKPITGAEASSGDASARSDDKGKILLTVDKPGERLEVTIKAKGYRDENITIGADDKSDHKIKLVPARREVFVSKRSGKFDVYSIDIDGKNEKLLLAGTGNEKDSIMLSVSPTDDIAALISTRDNVHNADGYLLSTLTLIDLTSGETTKVAQSERLQPIDWIGHRLVYVQIAAGASAANPKRERLVSYDTQTKASKELAATNYFNDVLAAAGQIFYAPSAAFQTPGSTGLFRIQPDGTNRSTILGQEVWNIFRTSYEELSLSVQQGWYTYHLGNAAPSKASGAPSSLKSRLYIDNPENKNSLWVDNRDGKGVLVLYDSAAKTEKVLQTQSGLQYPIRWLNGNTVIYRIHTDQETADYALSVDGGRPVKIRDVTNTAGISSWYYY